VPFNFHEQIVPEHPTKHPDNPEETLWIPEKIQITADFRMRFPLEMKTSGPVERTLDERRELMKLHLTELMHRALFLYTTGTVEWGENPVPPDTPLYPADPE